MEWFWWLLIRSCLVFRLSSKSERRKVILSDSNVNRCAHMSLIMVSTFPSVNTPSHDPVHQEHRPLHVLHQTEKDKRLKMIRSYKYRNQFDKKLEEGNTNILFRCVGHKPSWRGIADGNLLKMQYTPCECNPICEKDCQCQKKILCCEKYCGCDHIGLIMISTFPSIKASQETCRSPSHDPRFSSISWKRTEEKDHSRRYCNDDFEAPEWELEAFNSRGELF